MDQLIEYIIRFDNMEAADAGQAAESLRRVLREIDAGIVVKRERTDADAMDFGSALGIILAAPAVVELARGIANWLARSHTSKVTIVRPDGSTVVENIGVRDAVHLAEKLGAEHARR